MSQALIYQGDKGHPKVTNVTIAYTKIWPYSYHRDVGPEKLLCYSPCSLTREIK